MTTVRRFGAMLGTPATRDQIPAGRPHGDGAKRGIRSAHLGILVNTGLAMTKLVAGIVGNSYALVADAVESIADILSSLIVWSGLSVASRDPDETYPFGYGKAESLAAAVVSLMLLGAATGICIEAIQEIRTPHHTPAPWTLAVLVGVILVKALLSKRVGGVGHTIGSTAVQADAWHHMSDAITSAAAFVGISIAVLGGPGWEAADDWAALVAESVPGVLATEKLAMRRTGMTYRVTIHVQTDPEMPLHEAHVLSGKVKSAIRAALPQVQSVLVHMEPFESTPHAGR